MPRFDIPRMLRPLYLRDYAAEFADACIQVWVNPPRELLHTYAEILVAIESLQAQIKGNKEPMPPEKVEQLTNELVACKDRLIAWFGEIWSQGAEDSRWSAEDIQALLAHAQDTDPALWNWLVEHTTRLIGEHRMRQKKT
jgi:hypothetical protein